jgi:hypothetical protein
VRGLIAFVVLCLVSAIRPTPRPIVDDPRDAQLDVAKSRVERVASRRIEPDRFSRSPVLVAVVSERLGVVPPEREQVADVSQPTLRPIVPVLHARSSRGPPVA